MIEQDGYNFECVHTNGTNFQSCPIGTGFKGIENCLAKRRDVSEFVGDQCEFLRMYDINPDLEVPTSEVELPKESELRKMKLGECFEYPMEPFTDGMQIHKVSRGWIYCFLASAEIENSVSVTMSSCFVPDITHIMGEVVSIFDILLPKGLEVNEERLTEHLTRIVNNVLDERQYPDPRPDPHQRIAELKQELTTDEKETILNMSDTGAVVEADKKSLTEFLDDMPREPINSSGEAHIDSVPPVTEAKPTGVVINCRRWFKDTAIPHCQCNINPCRLTLNMKCALQHKIDASKE